ncbi:MAG: MFS transporter [Clostridiales bacterium]|nr:MFS transporter [Clostridiales bacterium]
MMTLLLLVIYITFIGLGLPDSILGSAWPAIYIDFNLPVSSQSLLTILISTGTVTASIFSARLINKFGTGLLTAISTLLSTICLLCFSFSNSFYFLLLLAFPLGAGAGAIDAALNNYVSVHYSATKMNFLHSFYGVGVALSPYIMSFALAIDNNWRQGYRMVFFIMLAISIIAFASLPLWEKAQQKDIESKKEQKNNSLSLIEIAKIPTIKYAWIAYFSTVALEFTCGIWGCTYLVSSELLSESFSAKLITLYYIGITLGRFLSGIVSVKLNNQQIVGLGYSIVGVAVILMLLPVPAIVKGVALLLIGLGNGPTFPNLIYLTPKFYGQENSQAITGTLLAVCNVGILTIPPLFGVLAQVLSLKIFPLVILIFYVIMVISTIIYLKTAEKNSKGIDL